MTHSSWAGTNPIAQGFDFANVTPVWDYTLGMAEQVAAAAKKPL